MPSYLVSAKDAYVPQELYHPNFQAIQSIWSTKQAQYNQGLNELQNIYSSIYNSDVTNTQNAERKKQYIENANQQFKNLSQIDLSIQHNVDQSKGAFKPFEQDIALQRDIVATHKYQQGYAKAQALRDSSKAEDRDRYWDGGVRLMQLGQQRLQNGDPNDSSIYNVQGWVDKFDVNKYLGDEATKQKLDISWQKRANGAQIILGKNGPLSEDAYQKWASNMLYSNQGYIDFTKARVTLDLDSQKNNLIQQAAANGQHLTDKEAMSMVGNNLYQEDHSAVVKDLNDHTSQLNTLNKQIEDLKSNTDSITDPDLIQKAQTLKAKRDMLQQLVETDNSHLSQLNSDGVKDSYLNNFNAVGGDLLARRYMARDAANFADTWANTHSSQEIKDDPNYWKQKDYDLQREQFHAKIEYQGKQLQLENKKLNIDAMKSGKKSGSGNSNSSDGSSDPDEPQYTIDGKSTTDVVGYDIVTEHDKQQIEEYTRTYNNSSNSIFGALGIVDNMEPAEANNLTKQFKGLLTTDDVSKYLDQNPELKKYARQFTSSNNKYDIATAITKHAQDALSDVTDINKKAKLQNYVSDLVTMSSDIKGIVDRQQAFLDGQDQYYKDHPEDSKYFRTVGDKKEVLGALSIAKRLRSIKANDGTELSAQDIATSFTNGTLRVSTVTNRSGGVEYGGNPYRTINLGNKNLIVTKEDLDRAGVTSLINDLGNSPTFSQKSKEIQAKSINTGDTPYAMGNSVSFKIGKTSTTLDNQGNTILSGMQNGTDWFAGATDTQGNALEGDNIQLFINSLDPKDLTDKGITMKTLTTRGDRAFVLHLTPAALKKLDDIKGIDSDLIKAAKDGSLELHLNSTASGDWVKGLPDTATIRANAPITKEVYASDLEKANGIDYYILPEDGGVRVSYKTKVLDPKSGKEVWSDWEEPIVISSGQYSPEAIKRTLSEKRKQAVIKLAEERKALAQHQEASGQPGITYADIFNN